MGLGTYLIDKLTGHDLHIATTVLGHRTLVVATAAEIHSLFKARSETAAGTFELVAAKPNESIVITDILVSAKKFATGTLTLSFKDADANEEVIFAPDVSSDVVNVNIQLAGGWQGWMGGALQAVSVNNFDFTITVGYYRVPGGLSFADWDGRR